MNQIKLEPFTLPRLPDEQNALEPYISAKTLDFHHGKHHLAYVNKRNELVSGSALEAYFRRFGIGDFRLWSFRERRVLKIKEGYVVL